MRMKKILLILMAPLFTLFVAWGLSIAHEFNWKGIIFFVAVITALGIVLAFIKPEKLIDAGIGWIFSGVLFAFMATEGMLGVYTGLFKTIATATFAFTLSFTCILPVIKASTESPKQKP